MTSFSVDPGSGKIKGNGIFRQFVLDVISILGLGFGAGRAAAQPVLDHIQQDAYKSDPRSVLSLAEVAAAIVKNTDTTLDWTNEVAESGFTPERLKVETELTGNPPGFETLLEMWRRGFITNDLVHRGILQGLIKDEWTVWLEKLLYDTLSPAEVVAAAVQNHADDATARDLWAKGGGDPALYDIAYETAGNPPGTEEMLRLWNRGIATQEQVDQAIRESRIKDKYIPLIEQLRVYLPPPRTVTTLLSHGAIDRAKALQLWQDSGLAPDLAAAYADSAVHTATSSHKTATAAEVRELYAAGVITEAQALADLGQIGYDVPTATLLLDLAAAQQQRTLRNAIITRIRTAYISKKIDDAKAQSELAALNVDPAQITSLIDMWKVIAATPSKSLSIGELNSAYKKGVITLDDFLQRAEGLGYSPDDANILSQIDVPPTAPAAPVA